MPCLWYITVGMMLIILIYAAFASLIFAGLACIDILNYLGRHAKRVKDAYAAYEPHALVIIPCKGADPTLYENLLSIKAQHYSDYGIICVVDAADDAALPAIKKAGLRHMLSASQCKRCSGKVRAVSTALERFRGYAVYAIADSDITVPASWLKNLVQPLQKVEVGISSMFPHFKPGAGFWSKVKLVWGYVGEGLMQHELTRFAWGGSLAFRRELLDKTSLRFFKDSEYSVSDDICLTKLAAMKGLRIAYVSEGRPHILSFEGFKGFAEWANRQTALSMLGYRRNLYMGLAFYSAESIAAASALMLSYYLSPFFIILLLHYAKNLASVYKRSGLHFATAAAITFILPYIYLLNLVYASRMRSISWRGRVYRIR